VLSGLCDGLALCADSSPPSPRVCGQRFIIRPLLCDTCDCHTCLTLLVICLLLLCDTCDCHTCPG
jgi:hypothetical protein